MELESAMATRRALAGKLAMSPLNGSEVDEETDVFLVLASDAIRVLDNEE
jgi:hypothetical protein